MTVLSPQAARGRSQESLYLYGRQRSLLDSVSKASVMKIYYHGDVEFCKSLGFLRKVYGILTAQLLITVLIGAVCITVPQVRATVQGRYGRTAF